MSPRPRRARAPTLALALALALVFANCSGERFDNRAPFLVSTDRGVDATLARARVAAADSDWSQANALLRDIETRHPRDPMALVAAVLRARVSLARDDVDGAASTVIAVPPGRDPALDMQRDLVLGLVAARRRDTARGTWLLRPLARRMIDRAQTAEVACGLAELDASQGSDGAARALGDLAQVESLAEDGVLWLPTGLPCDQQVTRAAAFIALLGRVESLRALADALDTLPAESPRRRPVARRLREVAVAHHEIDRWRHWLADLPAGEATLMPVAGDAGPPPLVVGVLAPVSGPRASIGVTVVREVQLALEGDRATAVLLEDEGATPQSALAAFERLAAQHPAAVVGPTQEELARAVAPRAVALGVDVYLLAPYGNATGGGPVHLAGPDLQARTVRIATTARGHGTRAALVVPEGDTEGEFIGRLRTSLSLAGVVSGAPGEGAGASALHVVAGPFGSEALRAHAGQSEGAPGRWVFDGRAGQPGSPGWWVGLRAGPDFAQHHARYCDVAGEPAGELGMLAYDAAQRVLSAVRGGDPERVLDPAWTVDAVLAGPEGTEALAVTRHCPVNPPPPSMDTPDGGE